ncbi:MAG: CpaE family protein [Armatimonadota bacterium]
MARDGTGSIRIIITEPQPGASADLQAQLAAYFEAAATGGVDVVAVAHDGLEAAQMAAQLKPDVILLDEEMPGMSGYEAAELIALAAPDVASVLMVPQGRANDRVVINRALRSGARAVIDTGITIEELVEVLEGLAELPAGRQRPEYDLVTDPAKMPVTIAVTGAKGGIGKSLLATNLAVIFARKYPRQTVLVDFYGQYGNAAVMLDVTPSYDIAELASFAGEMDSSILETHLSTHPESGLRLLAGHAGSAGINGRLDGDQEIAFLADLIGLLRRQFRFAFFDVPPLVGRASDYIFSRAQYIVLVSALTDLVTVRDTAALYRHFIEERIAPERIKLVVNRESRANVLAVEDLEQATGTRVVHRIAEDSGAAVGSINEGAPVVLSRSSSALARGVRELADLLEQSMAEERRRRGATH